MKYLSNIILIIYFVMTTLIVCNLIISCPSKPIEEKKTELQPELPRCKIFKACYENTNTVTSICGVQSDNFKRGDIVDVVTVGLGTPDNYLVIVNRDTMNINSTTIQRMEIQ